MVIQIAQILLITFELILLCGHLEIFISKQLEFKKERNV
jgi:hypothetical protein